MRNLLLTIEYDGTNFSGWQRQPDKRTVQGELERVLHVLCRENVRAEGTSRTDAGVHALGQRATVRGDFAIPADRLVIAANNLLAGGKDSAKADVRIIDACEMPKGFHARFDAKGKTYAYNILAGAESAIFDRQYNCLIKKNLDVDKMREAAKHIVGTHDFKCFQASGGEEKETTVRTVWDLKVFSEANATGTDEKAQKITIEVSGDGFLYNMVRIIAGTLIEVGLGKKTPDQLESIIAGLDRKNAGYTAPPQGLFLKEIYYSTGCRTR